MEQQVVALYGASLFMAGVETSLKDRADLDVVRIDITLPNIEKHLKSLCPDVIIFDSDDSSLSSLPRITQLLKEYPEALAIGLDLNTNNTVTVFSSQQHSVTKVEDLVEAIQINRARPTQCE